MSAAALCVRPSPPSRRARAVPSPTHASGSHSPPSRRARADRSPTRERFRLRSLPLPLPLPALSSVPDHRPGRRSVPGRCERRSILAAVPAAAPSWPPRRPRRRSGPACVVVRVAADPFLAAAPSARRPGCRAPPPQARRRGSRPAPRAAFPPGADPRAPPPPALRGGTGGRLRGHGGARHGLHRPAGDPVRGPFSWGTSRPASRMPSRWPALRRRRGRRRYLSSASSPRG